MTIVFIGAFEIDHFLAFVDHRAGRLDLTVALLEAGPRRIGVVVTGEPDLVDAFEMACSLGPADCLVLEIIRQVQTEATETKVADR